VSSDDPDALAAAIRSFLEDPKPFWDRAENALLDYESLRWGQQAERLGCIVRELAVGKQVQAVRPSG
jgi:hypothetical protein